MLSKTKIKRFIKTIESYLWGIKIKTWQSATNGTIDLWFINNKLVLNTQNANQSYDSLHRVFQTVFEKINIKQRNPKSILLLGLGGGSVPTIIYEECKLNPSIVAIEHDSTMLSIANEIFNINRFKNLQTIIDDAFDFTLNNTQTFDLIIVDVFQDNMVPKKFISEAFCNRIITLLNSNGIIVFNVITESVSQKNDFNTLKIFFKEAEIIKADNYNSVLVFTNS
ncbi:MAG: fused MFS/spermidine synthase [Bacteroidia bacterium]|nr:fused MFS/spermidine synthase [Bacteroidia bacterium]MCC7534195.1 fused MFS/spermidine synthase [Bacteroidia bacterium]